MLDQTSLVRQDVATFMCILSLLWSSWWYLSRSVEASCFWAGQYIVIGMQQHDDSLPVHAFDLMEWCAHGIVVHDYLHLELLFLILRHVGEHIGPDQSLAGSAYAHQQCFHLFLSPLLVGNVQVSQKSHEQLFQLLHSHKWYGASRVAWLAHSQQEGEK